MRKSVKPVPVWPSNGAVYPRRAPSYPDSYNRRFLNQSCRFPQSKTCHGEHTTIFLSRNRRLRKFDQLCRIDDGLRRFSASTPKESDGFDEEEEDDLAASSSEMSRMVRRRVNPIKEAEERARQKREEEQVLMRRREELQERVDRRANELRTAVVLLQKIKQHAEEQRRAHEEWMRRYEQVITNSGTLVNAESQLFEEYFTLKYSEAGVVGSFIDNNARVLGQSQAEVSNCRQALRRIELASRRIDLEMQLARFAATLGSVAETFSDYHVTPIASARRNMENLLMPLTRFSSQYVDLQESGYKINLGNVRIISLLKEIDIKDPMRKYFHAKLQEKVDNGNNELMLTLHEYRSVKRILQWRGPLGQSHMLTMVQNYFSYRVIEMLASDLRMTKGRLINNLHTHGSASLLAHWYLPRWKEGAPRSVNLDIAWRHLDVYHSFDLLYISTRRISIEVRRLSAVLSETGDFGIRSLISLKEWSRAFIVMHSATLNNIEMLRCYTWLRLETENKVSKLGGVPDTISRGLFTPKDPISSDLRRFFLYADAIGDGMAQCINLGEALERFGRLKQPTTSDLIKLIDFSPSSRRGLDRLPGIAKSVPMRKVLNSRVPMRKVLNSRVPMRKVLNSRVPTRKVLNSRVPMRKVLISSVPMRKVLISSVHVRKVLISRRKTTPLRQTNERVPPGRSQARPLGVSDVQALLKRAGARMKRANTTNPEAILTTTGMSKVKITAPPSRRYYTDSKSFANHDGRQCGVSEPEIALINKDQIVQTELSSSIRAEDIEAADSLVSDAKHSDIISSHVLPDNSDDNKPQFWSYSQHRTPDGGKIPVYYCKDLERAERAAALFSSSEVLGFDIEWKPQAQITSGIKNNVSLIQIANEERIALFHIALFRGNEIDDLVPPSLRHLLESTRTVKVGVSIKADCSRVRRHLGIDTRSQLELSHLYKLVKYGSTQPKLVDRRTVNLAQQVEEVLGLPLRKDGDVRKSDWTKPLDYAQVQYAASDAYACICLHRILDAKRKALDPVPPLPAFAELNLPILLVEEGKGTLDAEPGDEIVELSLRTERSLKVVVKPEGVKDDVVVKIEN